MFFKPKKMTSLTEKIDIEFPSRVVGWLNVRGKFTCVINVRVTGLS